MEADIGDERDLMGGFELLFAGFAGARQAVDLPRSIGTQQLVRGKLRRKEMSQLSCRVRRASYVRNDSSRSISVLNDPRCSPRTASS